MKNLESKYPGKGYQHSGREIFGEGKGCGCPLPRVQTN